MTGGTLFRPGREGTGRALAVVIAVVAVASLGTRVWLSARELGGVMPALSQMSQFFTVLTNAAVAVMMLRAAALQPMDRRWMRALVIAIAGVGLVYHTLLAGLVDLSGIAMVVDHGFHTVVPLLTVIWWLLLVEPPAVNRADPARWIAWPLAYSLYALMRAEWSAFYPYPFLDLAKLGLARLVINMTGLAVGFVLFGLAVTVVERMVRRR